MESSERSEESQPRSSTESEASQSASGSGSSSDEDSLLGEAGGSCKIVHEPDLSVGSCSRPGDVEDGGRQSESVQTRSTGARGKAKSKHTSFEAMESNDMARRKANIEALKSNSLMTCRKPLVPKLLKVEEAQIQLRMPFKSPKDGAPRCSQDLRRRLVARRSFVPWGLGKSPWKAPSTPIPASPPKTTPSKVENEEDFEGVEPLVLWAPDASMGEKGNVIEVDKRLTKFLRPHQREGVQFMFECMVGMKNYDGQGCILADDMGLGKTLQGITLMWTLLQQGADCLGGCPLAKRAIIVCPTSLVSNWESECEKWLQGSVKAMALSESSRDEVIQGINQFLHPRNPYHVLIISYETFRIHAEKFDGPESCDLLLCDEAHRLKNDSTLTNKALDRLHCRRRILLSGTPLQNHLEEFYAMVNFCNPGVLGSPSAFRRTYEQPILVGREPHATEEEVTRGQERSEELSNIVNQFILRRTNKLLSAHLPPKVVEVVCCRLTPLQESLYCHFLRSTAARRLLKEEKGAKSAGVLSAITSLKKLCNHPKLIHDAIHSAKNTGKEQMDGFQGCDDLFPPGAFRGGSRSGLPHGWENMSGKMAVLGRMLALLKSETKDRIVVVSNYTQTLDLIASLCRGRGYPCLRLDGSTSISKRQKLVVKFNDPNQTQFVFLLSSKAGGCGLNLIGGNRLVLFDPDWNPANDKQAAARVWRDGQKKQVFVYRFLSTGTIEEKVFQRQLSKEGLQGVVNQSGHAGSSLMSSEELRNLFTLNKQTQSDTYDSISGAANPQAVTDLTEEAQCREQIGNPGEEDLVNWAWHFSASTVPDDIMRKAACEEVSFIFTCSVQGKEVSADALEGENIPPAPVSTPVQNCGNLVDNRDGSSMALGDCDEVGDSEESSHSGSGTQMSDSDGEEPPPKRRLVVARNRPLVPVQPTSTETRKRLRVVPRESHLVASTGSGNSDEDVG